MSAICWKWARVYRAWLRSGTTLCRSSWSHRVSLALCVYTATSAHFPPLAATAAHRPINLLSISLILFYFVSCFIFWWPLTSHDSWLGFRALAAIDVRWNARQTEPGSGTPSPLFLLLLHLQLISSSSSLDSCYISRPLAIYIRSAYTPSLFPSLKGQLWWSHNKT